jgi:hypothetical protein
MAPRVVATSVDEDPQVYEDKNVHAIYDEIAPHFSSTRYKASRPDPLSQEGVEMSRIIALALAYHRDIHLKPSNWVGWT